MTGGGCCAAVVTEAVTANSNPHVDLENTKTGCGFFKNLSETRATSTCFRLPIQRFIVNPPTGPGTCRIDPFRNRSIPKWEIELPCAQSLERRACIGSEEADSYVTV